MMDDIRKIQMSLDEHVKECAERGAEVRTDLKHAVQDIAELKSDMKEFSGKLVRVAYFLLPVIVGVVVGAIETIGRYAWQ